MLSVCCHPLSQIDAADACATACDAADAAGADSNAGAANANEILVFNDIFHMRNKLSLVKSVSSKWVRHVAEDFTFQ